MPHSASAGDVAAFLAKLVRLANSNIQFESKAANLLSLAAWQLGLDKTLLLFLDRKSRELTLFPQADDLRAPRGPMRMGDSIFDRAAQNRQSLLADQGDFAKLPPEWAEYLTPYIGCLAVVPILDDKTCYGLLLLLAEKSVDLSSGHNSLVVEAVANQLAMAIKTNQLATDTRKRISVLNVLSDLGRTLASTIEVEKVMSIVPRIATGVFVAEGCAINVLDLQGTLLHSSLSGAVPPAYNFLRYKGMSLPVSFAETITRDTTFMGRLQDDPKKLELTAKERSSTIISMPLMFQGSHLGNISLFNKLGGHGEALPNAPALFDREDLELLQAMNSIISGVVENALTFKKVESLAKTNEGMVRYLSNLYDISSAMMTTVRYDELVWIIVQALTLRQGLGFDKVLILLMNLDGKEPTLTSSAYWSAQSSQDEPLAPLPEVLRRPSIEEAQAMMEAGAALKISIPVSPQSNRILARVTVEKRPLLGFRGLDPHDDLDLGDFGLRAYAAVPMLAKGREVGVIAVDRSLSGLPLTVDSLRDLTMLANQAGLAIENTQLYDDLRQANTNLSQVRGRLIEAEKRAAQGEMGTQLAHEIRNPLVSIGGFTQRLIKKMAPEDPLRRYPQVILEEVERLNGVLNNVLDFSRDERGLVKAFQLEDVAKEVLGSLNHELERTKVTVIPDFEEGLPKVLADDRQVSHVFLNLIYNSSQAMSAQNGGLIYMRIYLTRDGETQYVACQVTDTGPGIPEELVGAVFNPFFTTKTQGTGLGLSIVQKIVDRYNGQLSVQNHPPEYENGGASFTFMFPAVSA